MRPLLFLIFLLLALPALAQPTKRTIRVRKEKPNLPLRYARYDSTVSDVMRQSEEVLYVQRYRRCYHSTSNVDVEQAKASPNDVERLSIGFGFESNFGEENRVDMVKFIREQVPRFKNLAQLDISFNQAKDEFDVAQLDELRRFATLSSLRYVRLYHIPQNPAKRAALFEALASLSQVRHLDLFCPEASQLGAELLKLTQIEEVGFRYIPLKDYPQNIFNMPRIAHLEIGYSEGMELDARLAQAKYIKSIIVLDTDELDSLDFTEKIKKMLPDVEVTVAHFYDPE